jgi:hypothetical protein
MTISNRVLTRGYVATPTPLTAVAWRNALAVCNIDKATLREWAEIKE